MKLALFLVFGLLLAVVFAQPNPAGLNCPSTTFTHDVEPMAGDLFKLIWRTAESKQVDWVDIHYKINDGPFMNYRMDIAQPNVLYHHLGLNHGGIQLNEGDQLTYFFSYCVGGVDCDSDLFSWNRHTPELAVVEMPAGCPTINHDHRFAKVNPNLWEIQFVVDPSSLATQMDWVDVHYQINKAEVIPDNNFRMDMVDGFTFKHSGVPMGEGDIIRYFFTYCTSGTDCDSEWLEWQVPTFQPELPVVEEMTGCPAIEFEHMIKNVIGTNLWHLQFSAIPDSVPTAGLDWVDVHYQINKNDLIPDNNFRMDRLDAMNWLHTGLNQRGIQLNVGDVLRYWFTYCTGSVDCDSEMYEFTVPSPEPELPVVEASLACPAIEFDHMLQQMGQNLWSMKFLPIPGSVPAQGLDWVDVHYQINKNDLIPDNNFRMDRLDAMNWLHTGLNQQGIQLNVGDVLRYWFTYCTGGVDCDTEMFEFTVPSAELPVIEAPSACPAIQYDHRLEKMGNNLWSMRFLPIPGSVPAQGLDWVDVHYQINKNDLIPDNNFRMDRLDATNWLHTGLNRQGIQLNVGDVLRYWFTYCTGGVDCDSEMFEFIVR